MGDRTARDAIAENVVTGALIYAATAEPRGRLCEWAECDRPAKWHGTRWESGYRSDLYVCGIHRRSALLHYVGLMWSAAAEETTNG